MNKKVLTVYCTITLSLLSNVALAELTADTMHNSETGVTTITKSAGNPGHSITKTTTPTSTGYTTTYSRKQGKNTVAITTTKSYNSDTGAQIGEKSIGSRSLTRTYTSQGQTFNTTITTGKGTEVASKTQAYGATGDMYRKITLGNKSLTKTETVNSGGGYTNTWSTGAGKTKTFTTKMTQEIDRAAGITTTTKTINGKSITKTTTLTNEGSDILLITGSGKQKTFTQEIISSGNTTTSTLYNSNGKAIASDSTTRTSNTGESTRTKTRGPITATQTITHPSNGTSTHTTVSINRTQRSRFR